MSVSFQCPSCQAVHSVAPTVVGRRVRCPECDTLVTVDGESMAAVNRSAAAAQQGRDEVGDGGNEGRGTVMLAPPTSSGTETVMLEMVDVVPDEAGISAGMPPAKPPQPPKRKESEQPEEEEPVFKTRLTETEMDMTPMVDVTFQLLIFFMITAAFALQKAKEIPKPTDQDPSTNVVIQEQEDPEEFVTVRIDEYNTFLVINPDGEEEEAPSVQDLYIKLRRAKTGGTSGKIPTKLRVEAHGDSLHEKVVAALDAGNETGFAELELATASEDAE